jgi:uncharacterized protein YndB with AHSA1/START domain
MGLMAKKPSQTAGTGRLDLTITRIIDAPRALVWDAWTKPEHLKKWWAPKPTEITECEIDLRPGGTFYWVMTMPDGGEQPVRCSFLDIVPMQRLVFTDTLLPGWRPASNPFFAAVITMEDEEDKTKYTARAMHKDEADCAKHEEMGFFDGWGTVIDQLADLVATLKGKV